MKASFPALKVGKEAFTELGLPGSARCGLGNDVAKATFGTSEVPKADLGPDWCYERPVTCKFCK